MTTRTELIARLRLGASVDRDRNNITGFAPLADAAADMLEADERVNAAFNEWHSKTEWVQETAKPKELGMHRADALKQRANKLREAARLALDALINGKKVRNGEGGTAYQPPLEDAAIAALKEVL